MKSYSDRIFLKHFKHSSMSVNTLLKYLHELTIAVEKRIADILQSKLAVLFDGCAGGNSHYVSLFSTYPDHSSNGYRKLLLGVSQMKIKDFFSAIEH